MSGKAGRNRVVKDVKDDRKKFELDALQNHHLQFIKYPVIKICLRKPIYLQMIIFISYSLLQRAVVLIETIDYCIINY